MGLTLCCPIREVVGLESYNMFGAEIKPWIYGSARSAEVVGSKDFAAYIYAFSFWLYIAKMWKAHIYIYIYVCMYIHIYSLKSYICIYTYIYSFSPFCYIYTYIYVYICIYTYIYLFRFFFFFIYIYIYIVFGYFRLSYPDITLDIDRT